jgi:alpha-1,2-mannosyltransferase
MTYFRQASAWQQAWRQAWQQAWQQLRSGRWLTVERARAYTLILLSFYAIAVVGWIALSGGLIDPNGKPLGTDFSSFYAAGSLALDGRAGDVYDMAAHYSREQQIFGAATPYYGWLYPPLFLLLVAPLALLPYPLALLVWQGATFALYLAVIGAILQRLRRDDATLARLWLPAAAAFPAAFINLGHGQNGCLTAGLLGAALVTLPRRPLLAGVLFGLLAYKPQFGLLIPVALLAAGQWRTILVAGVTVTALVIASVAAFGTDIWWLFAASTETSRKLLLEQGNVGFEKLQSVFAAVRMLGGGISLAYVVQGAASLATILGVAWAWRSSDDHNLKSAIIIIATLLGSPHVLDYDLTILAPALAFIVASRWRDGFRDLDVSVLTFAWFVPLCARAVAGATCVPVGLIAVAMLYNVVIRYIRRERAMPSLAASSVAQA